MATSTIQKPIKGYYTVASSGSANETWGTKLARLDTPFNNLSTEEKMKAHLYVAGSICHVASVTDNVFFRFSLATVSGALLPYLGIFDLTNHTYKRYLITSNGTFTITDYTNSNIATNIYLQVII